MPLRQPKFCRLSPEDRSVVTGLTESVCVQSSSAMILRYAFYVLHKRAEPFRIVQEVLKIYKFMHILMYAGRVGGSYRTRSRHNSFLRRVVVVQFDNSQL